MYPNPHSPHGRISTPYINGECTEVWAGQGRLFQMAVFPSAALASQGMTFTDAYAGAPVCAPSRCALVSSPLPPELGELLQTPSASLPLPR